MGYRRRDERGEEISGEKEFYGVYRWGFGYFCAYCMGVGKGVYFFYFKLSEEGFWRVVCRDG